MKPRFVLLGSMALVAVLLLVISNTGAAENDAVWYGAIAVFVITQIAFIAYMATRRRNDD